MIDHLRSLTTSLLDAENPVYTLRPEMVELMAILRDFQSTAFVRQNDITEGETRTPNGLAVSPTMAAMCADDYVRTITFMRGAHAAILDIQKEFPERPVRVLYVGCGPYATLAVPLMTVLSSREISFTLLDVHPESIDSVKTIINSLGLTDAVASYETMDADSYRVSPDQPPDIILMEIMQACLQAEPQVAITRHLLKQAQDSILVPEEVRIDLILTDISREFNFNSPQQYQGSTQRDRIAVSPVFTLNRETVKSWNCNQTNRLPASDVRIPSILEERYQPMLFTTVQVYKNYVLRDYDSGLTCPRALSIGGALKPGDTIKFHYELGEHPGLHAEVSERLDKG